ncbi:hypothetical protein B0H11DRAFT_2244200 [Mycena galericulata]|nr:hypothetical protein B0H11DRAFT_2244200 [Mycena galericulata]
MATLGGASGRMQDGEMASWPPISNIHNPAERTTLVGQASYPQVSNETVPLVFITQSSGWAAKELIDPMADGFYFQLDKTETAILRLANLEVRGAIPVAKCESEESLGERARRDPGGARPTIRAPADFPERLRRAHISPHLRSISPSPLRLAVQLHRREPTRRIYSDPRGDFELHALGLSMGSR